MENKQLEKLIAKAVCIFIFLLSVTYTSITITGMAGVQNKQQQQINDLSNKMYNMELLYQNYEKQAETDTQAVTGTYLGKYTITYYCPCEKCCGKTDGITYSGTKATEGRTVGADLSVLPIGTKIYIEGLGERVVEDTGGGIKGNHIDVFVDSHEKALELGRATRKVYEVE